MNRYFAATRLTFDGFLFSTKISFLRNFYKFKQRLKAVPKKNQSIVNK